MTEKMPNNSFSPEMYLKKLESFLAKNNSLAQLISFTEKVHSVEQAANLLQLDPGSFIKSVCFESKSGDFVTAIVLGSSKVDTKKIESALNLNKLQPAKLDKILKNTGYEVGGIPPVGYDSIFLLDNQILQKGEVFAGGGNQFSLLKISPEEILRLNNAQIIDIAK